MFSKIGLAMAGALLAIPVHAASVDVLFGDIDGFGGQTAAGAVGADTGFNFANAAGDPFGTDVWLYVQDGGVSPINADFAYDLAGETPVSAVISLIETGMSDNRGPWNAFFNGHAVGAIPNLSIGPTISALYSFVIDPAWLTGADTFSMVYDDSTSDLEGFALDYVQLSIETVPSVPVPATLPLLLAGVGGFAALRRKARKA